MSAMNLSILIVDDEVPAQNRLSDLLSKDPEVNVAGICSDGSEAVEHIRAQKPNLVFLDVQMPVVDGFGVLRSIGPENMPATVFVTAYDQYAIQAFETNAIDYLLKPFSDERFEATMRRAKKYLASMNVGELSARLANMLASGGMPPAAPSYLSRIVLKTNGRVMFVETKDIDWIEGAGVYVVIHVGPKTFELRATIGQVEQRLNPRQFLRVHKSAIVNTARIQELHARTHGDYTIILKGGASIPLSRGHRPQIEEWLKQPL